jgi:hypothetical protein
MDVANASCAWSKTTGQLVPVRRSSRLMTAGQTLHEQPDIGAIVAGIYDEMYVIRIRQRDVRNLHFEHPI